MSTIFFKATGDMAKQCVNAGDPFACNPANYVIAPLAGVVFAPMGFLMGFFSETAQANYCGGRTRANFIQNPIQQTQEAPPRSRLAADEESRQRFLDQESDDDVSYSSVAPTEPE